MNILTEMKAAYEGQPTFNEEKHGRFGDRKWTNHFKKWLAAVVADQDHPKRAGAIKMLAVYDGPPKYILKIPTQGPYRLEFELQLRFTRRFHGGILGMRAYVSFGSMKQSHVDKVDTFIKESIASFMELAKSYGLQPEMKEDKSGWEITNGGYYLLMEREFYIKLNPDTARNEDFNEDYDLLKLMGVKYDKNS